MNRVLRHICRRSRSDSKNERPQLLRRFLVNCKTVMLSISGAVICQCVVGCVGAHTFMVSGASIETSYASIVSSWRSL